MAGGYGGTAPPTTRLEGNITLTHSYMEAAHPRITLTPSAFSSEPGGRNRKVHKRWSTPCIDPAQQQQQSSSTTHSKDRNNHGRTQTHVPSPPLLSTPVADPVGRTKRTTPPNPGITTALNTLLTLECPREDTASTLALRERPPPIPLPAPSTTPTRTERPS